MGLDQRLDFRTEKYVAAASLRQKRRTIAKWTLQGSMEQVIDLLPTLGSHEISCSDVFITDEAFPYN
jgi:hypothetical protein